MALTPGTRLGPYEVIGDLGSGGMGDVYRARDTRLDREVAVKTVKGPFTERFEREARAISSLNHPNICTLHDVGDHEGSGYLVLEYVDGRPISGPLPIDQALSYGVQICEALHAAHRKGIVHRDLKPANILVTKQGVKLLDFGLAKLSAAAGATQSSGSAAGGAGEHATIAALTGAHTVVGTPQYMAPEQIEGVDIDARADIFAFGCVLYEMLTGKPAFEGRTASTVMASILASQPRPLDELLPLTPPALERAVMRCLAKDPEDRWQSARDVAAELQWIAQGGSRVGLPPIVTVRRRTRERLAWAACVVAAIAVTAFAVAWVRRAPADPPLIRFAVQPPEGSTIVGAPAISPDGRMIVFGAADAGGRQQLWVRAMDAIEPRVLAGTEGALRGFWSPDSRFVGFFAGGKLRKVDPAGGPPQTICDAPTGADGSWNQDGVILFDGRDDDPILRVSASGGLARPEVSADPAAGVTAVGWPEFLPDGRHFLYVTFGTAPEDQALVLGTLDSPERKVLLKTTSLVQYTPPGYLLYVREQTLVAHPFDPSSFELAGEAVPIGEGLGVDSVGLASFSVSPAGVLVFRAGDVAEQQFLWVDRSGKESAVLEKAGRYRDAWLAPDGTRLAFEAFEGGGLGDIWIRDLVRSVSSRFTFDAARERNPIWSPDGRRIVFTSNAKGPGDLYVKDASGTREAEPLLVTPQEKIASDWTRDGKHLVYATQAKETGWDLWALPVEGDNPTPFPLVTTQFNDMFGTVSPDGKYLSYFSNESGQMQVYVQEFPEARNKWQISTSGGTQPFWRADGRELFYRAAGRLMAVPVTTGETFTVGIPEVLFQARFAPVTVRGHFRPTPDGQRFLVLAPPGRDVIQPTTVVLNWTAALRK